MQRAHLRSCRAVEECSSSRYAALRHNMEVGRGPIVEWLKQREAAQGKEMHK
jgi:hypothetical protein